MNLIETTLLNALKFRRETLWNILDDGLIYAVKLPDGDIGYYCVMGMYSEHFALGAYRGDDFSTYLMMIYASKQDFKRQIEAAVDYNFVKCEFVNADDPELTSGMKKMIKEVAANGNVKMTRPHGWPLLNSMKDGIMRFDIKDQKDLDLINYGLTAGIEISKIIKERGLKNTGFDEEKDYVSPEGGDEIPLLVPVGDDKFELSTTLTPSLKLPKIEPCLFEDDELASELKKRKKMMIYQAKYIHSPSLVKSDDGFFHPAILLLTRKVDSYLTPIFQDEESDTEGTKKGLLSQLANHFLMQTDPLPSVIEIEDEITGKIIADFCKKTGIRLQHIPFLKTLDDAWEAIFQEMTRQ